MYNLVQWIGFCLVVGCVLMGLKNGLGEFRNVPYSLYTPLTLTFDATCMFDIVILICYVWYNLVICLIWHCLILCLELQGLMHPEAPHIVVCMLDTHVTHVYAYIRLHACTVSLYLHNCTCVVMVTLLCSCCMHSHKYYNCNCKWNWSVNCHKRTNVQATFKIQCVVQSTSCT